MAERHTSNDSPSDGVLPSTQLSLRNMRETNVPMVSEAPTPPPRYRDGPRHVIPPVPEGPEIPDQTPSLPMTIETLEHLDTKRARSTMAAQDLVLVRNVALSSAAANNSASSTGEPSLATHDDVVFYTGNWYAALSTDGGATFRYINPYTAFPDPSGMGFCCDQVVQYIPQIDTFVWLLQYTENTQNENIQRLAFASTDDIVQGRWRIFDITPQSLGLPNIMLDFPDMAVGSNHLYVTTNGFRQNGSWTSTVVIRISVDSIRQNMFEAQHAQSTENFNFRVAQHCMTRAFWASHNTTSSLRVFSWDEGAPQPSFRDVQVARWAAGHFESLTPDQFNWLNRSDPRVEGAVMVAREGRNELWFAWNANRGGINNRPNPYVQIARINADDFTLLENVNLWDANFAIAYAALTSNSEGEVGTSYAFGGRRIYPSHAVGILTPPTMQVTVDNGAHGPETQRWGDYFTVRRHTPNTKLFAAAGYTLQNGTGRTAGSPRFVLFGRAGALEDRTAPTLETLAAKVAEFEGRLANLEARLGTRETADELV